MSDHTRTRRKAVTHFKADNFVLRLGGIVTAYWGGQVEGQKPRTRKGTINRLLDDGSFRATCHRTGKNFHGNAGTVKELIR